MTSEQKGKVGQEDCPMADYGQRAATALDELIPGPHRDKAVARLFGVSVRFAKYLRAGQFWTAARMTQASAALGEAFDAALMPASDEQRKCELAEIAEIIERLARLETRFETLDSRDGSRLASTPGGEAVDQGRERVPTLGLVPRSRDADRDGEATPDAGEALAHPLQRREVRR